jgi:uncharacterized repeat protein (TIGR02543 family)
MISRKANKPSPGRLTLGKLVTVASVAIMSSVMVSVPAHALTSDPTLPSLQPGGPSPAITLTSTSGVTNNLTTGSVQVDFQSGSTTSPGSQNNWAPKDTCPSSSSKTTTLSACGVSRVDEIMNGGSPTNVTGVKVSKTDSGDGLLITFDPARVADQSNTRRIVVVLDSGAFISPSDANGFTISMTLITEPIINVNGVPQTNSIGQQLAFSYVGANFVGGPGASGSMPAVNAPSNSNLPANAFTKSGYTFSGWSCSDGGEVVHRDQSRISLLQCSTLYAVWTAVGSSTTPSGASAAPASTTPTTTAPTTTAPLSTTPAARLATTGTNLSAWVPVLALAFGWMLVTYSRSLRDSRAKHRQI